jgi:hypothetical protein
MPKKSRIRQTKQKKSALQRQKQSQDVKQSVRVIVNLKERRARRRPARKATVASPPPFRGEPIGGVSRFYNDRPPIMSGNISDDQRKAIEAEGQRQLRLEYDTQKLNSDREAAIENDRDVPRLAFGGRRSESNFSTASGSSSLSGSLARIQQLSTRLADMSSSSVKGYVPSVAPSLMTATKPSSQTGSASAEQDLSGFGGRGKDASKKIADELRKLTGGTPDKMRSASNLRGGGWTTDMINELDNQAKAYLSRNPTTSLNKTVQKRIRDLATGAVVLGQVEEVLPEDEDGDFV